MPRHNKNKGKKSKAAETGETATNQKEENDTVEEVNTSNTKQSRTEKKVRKAITKLGMKAMSNINRVTIKKGGTQLFVIEQPDVFKSTNDSNTFIVFGEALYKDLTAAHSTQAAQEFANMKASGDLGATTGLGNNMDINSNLNTIDENDDVDETGIEEKDINLLMSQIGCTRQQAVRALKDNNNDVVNAIMALT